MLCEELEIVWNNIKVEVRMLVDCELMLVSFYYVMLFKYENFGSVLSYMLVNKLLLLIMFVIVICEVVEEVYVVDLEMIVFAVCDIQVVCICDLAVDKYLILLLYLKGFYVLQVYCIGYWLWNQGCCVLVIFL